MDFLPVRFLVSQDESSRMKRPFSNRPSLPSRFLDLTLTHIDVLGILGRSLERVTHARGSVLDISLGFFNRVASVVLRVVLVGGTVIGDPLDHDFETVATGEGAFRESPIVFRLAQIGP
jgi:hypothetical protein